MQVRLGQVAGTFKLVALGQCRPSPQASDELDSPINLYTERTSNTSDRIFFVKLFSKRFLRLGDGSFSLLMSEPMVRESQFEMDPTARTISMVRL